MANIEKRKTIKALLNQEDVKSRFNDMLGKRSSGFLTSVISAVQNNDKLKGADPTSIMFAAATAASLDLPINQNLGFAYIIPYDRKQKDGTFTTVAQFQMGYRGFIQLAQRSGQFKTISSTPIYEGQIVSQNPLTGYEFDFEVKGEKVIGYAAHFALINGFSKTLFMSVDELKTHGSKFSKTYSSKYSLWKTDFDSMASKTVLKMLLQKYAPLSIDMQTAVMTDQGMVNDWESQDVTYVDNERVKLDHNEVSNAKQRERISAHIAEAGDMKTLSQVQEILTDKELQEEYKNKMQELSS